MNKLTTADMGTQKINPLLRDSAEKFRERLLKSAANSAQIALDFGKTEGASTNELICANILLNRIYTTNGIYQGEKNFFTKALSYIKAAKNLIINDIKSTQHLADVLLYEGVTRSNIGEHQEANQLFKEVIEISTSREDEYHVVLALVAMSKNSVLQNEFSQAEQLVADAHSFLQASNLADEESLLAEVYEKTAEAHIKKQQYSESLKYSQNLLEIARKNGDIEKELNALKFIAIVCAVKSNYKFGMQYFFEALDKSEQIGYRPNTAHILINIATIYAHLYNYDDALSRYHLVLSDFDDVIDDNTRAAVYNNAGNIFYATDRHQEALESFESSLAIAEQCNYKEMTVHSLAQLSRAESRLGNYSKSLEYANRAEGHLQYFGDINGKQINQLNLAKLFLLKEDTAKALKLGQAGIETAKKLKDDVSQLRGHRILSNIYKAMRDFEKALKHQTQYSLLQEEFSKIQRNRRFLDLEIRHAIKEQQKEIQALTKENEYQSLLLSQSDQIARQNEELLQVNEDLRQFAYVASHDLKEPLRMISSYTQLIERMCKDIPEEKQQYFEYVKDGAKRMSNLLDDLLRYASIGKANIDKEIVDINRVLEVCCFNLKVRIEENNAVIDIPQFPAIYTNKPLLNQLFQNLLSNAVKFRKPDVDPIVLVRHEENEKEHIFSVSDNGIGIPEEFRERIFIIFQRLHARTKYEGTGIGLAICQKIAQKLGGKLWLESEEGKGSTFYFSLPKED